MAKYRVLNTTILHNGESQGEGSIIELTDEQAKKLADYVELVEDTEVSNTSGGSDTSNTQNNSDDTSGQTHNQSSNQTQNEPINQPQNQTSNQTDNTVSDNGNTAQSDAQSGSKKNNRTKRGNNGK